MTERGALRSDGRGAQRREAQGGRAPAGKGAANNPVCSTPDQPAARGVRIGGKAEEGEEEMMLAAVACLCIIGWLVDILIEKKKTSCYAWAAERKTDWLLHNSQA